MRFLIHVDVEAPADGSVPKTARLTLTCPALDGTWGPASGRTVSLVPDARGGAMPLPPVAPPPGTPHASLCSGNTAEFLQGLANFRARRAERADVFGRYLFEVLVGGEWWAKIIDTKPADALVELALSWRALPIFQPFDRLPWELMHAGARPLVASFDPRVAITRVIERDPAETARESPAALDLPVRVLFVLGSTADDPRIRAATEILGVLRSLEQPDRVQARVIARATPNQVSASVEHFRPQVVHFLCHGDVRDGRGYLELVPDEAGERPECYGDRLLDILRPGGVPPPTVVVLGACRSADRADFGDGAPDRTPQDYAALPGRPVVIGSLGIELVRGGVPIVVGMAGRVADVAARLFSRRLEASLLEGKPLVSATADARRAPFALAGGPRSIDWAYPTLFLDAAVDADYIPTPAPGSGGAADQLGGWVSSFRLTPANQPVFCDRQTFVDAFDDLFAGTGHGVLVAYARPNDERLARFGKSRLVEQLMFRALRAGHVPLIQKKPRESTPKTLHSLLDVLRKEQAFVTEQLGLTASPHRLVAALSTALRAHPADPMVAAAAVMPAVTTAHAAAVAGDQASPERAGERARVLGLQTLVTELEDAGLTGRAACLALQHDLWELARAFRVRLSGLRDTEIAGGRPVPGWLRSPDAARAVLFLDNLDLYDEGFVVGLQEIVTPNGLGTKEDPIPVVVTFTLDDGPGAQPLRPIIESPKPSCHVFELGAFAPGEDQLVYQRVLLHPFNPKLLDQLGVSSQMPFAVADFDDAGAARFVEDYFTLSLQGRPYRLGRELYLAAVMAVQQGYLIKADDADILRELGLP